MTDFTFPTDTIDYLLNRVKQLGVTKLKIKCEEFEIEIEAKGMPICTAESYASFASTAEENNTGAMQNLTTGNMVSAPIVGTFYAAPSPEKSPFVSIGQTVHKGDVLFIIESMKLMNEVKSEYDGQVTKILAVPGESVEYGQPIMIIE